MPAPQITPEGIRQTRAIAALLVKLTRTKWDDEMKAKIDPFLDAFIASDLFLPLLHYANMLLEGRYGSTEDQAPVPEGVDREMFELAGSLLADELRGQS